MTQYHRASPDARLRAWIFTPSLSGSTAVDRFARQRKSATEEERNALEALKRASFRLLRIRSHERNALFSVEDLATEKILSLLDHDLPVTITGLTFAARLCPLPGGIFVPIGPLGAPRILGVNYFPEVEDDSLLFTPEESELNSPAMNGLGLRAAQSPAESMTKLRRGLSPRSNASSTLSCRRSPRDAAELSKVSKQPLI